jgi:hypothetical protein
MNANELAIELEHYLKGEEYDRIVWEIPDFLRQQQVEINSLRNNGYKTHYELLRLEFLNQQAEIEALKDFAIWMTGCGYDFCQHQYFIKCRDELLVGKAQEK